MQNIYWDWYTAGISIQFYTHIGLHGYGLGYRIHQYNRTTERDGHPMDIRWTSDVRHRWESSATRRTSCCYDQSHFCNCQGATMSCDMHVTTWTAVTAATACDSTMCLALFGSFSIEFPEPLKITSKSHSILKSTHQVFPKFPWPDPPGVLRDVEHCIEMSWEPMRTNENQLAMCQKKRGS